MFCFKPILVVQMAVDKNMRYIDLKGHINTYKAVNMRMSFISSSK